MILTGCAQPPKNPDGRSQGLPRVDHILIEVSDMKTSLAFYRDLMGLKVKSDGGDFVMLEAANTEVALWTKRQSWGNKGERKGLGMYPHLKVADVSAFVEKARRASYKIVQEPKHYFWGTEAFIADPDGYIWAIVN
jgi:lactoylglutathione lyase